MITDSTEAPPLTEVVSYKGFNLDFTCRGMRYEIGKTYQHDGDVIACGAGFHACEFPLDVFGYYPPATSRYAEVRQSGEMSRDGDDSKIASATLTITVELSLHEMINRAVAWLVDHARPRRGKHPTGDQSVSSATGDRSVSSTTGYRSVSSTTGDQSVSSATGYRSVSSATGDQSVSSATGDQSVSSTTGYRSVSSTTGDQSVSSATGYRSVSSATGDQSAAMATGHEGRVMGANGNALFLVYRDPRTNEILHAWAGIVGRDGIEAGIWYSLGPDGRPFVVGPAL
jgi:hypothetical protein